MESFKSKQTCEEFPQNMTLKEWGRI